MILPVARPEDRRRDDSERPLWADTQPLCFRSEAFAEDLPRWAEGSAPARPGGRGSAPNVGDRARLLMPLLGPALALMQGLRQGLMRS